MEFNIVEKLLSFTLIGSEWVLWLLLGLSVISVAVMIERLIFFSRMRLDFGRFLQEFTAKLRENDVDGITKLCEGNSALECQAALEAFKYKDKGAQAMEESVSSYLASSRGSLDHGLVILGTLGNNAPFIGLFGTVIGIIQAFHDLANNPGGGPSVIMAGISEALVSTAVGLVVAIPAVIAYNGFQRVIKNKLANAEAVKKIIATHFV
ncbi:MAG: MotA/TolQ/ExbB proton channel family protein [Oligoflexales bacterium]